MISLFNRANKLKYIKIYGLPRSGTNYVAKLIETNFHSRLLLHVGQGKHEKPRMLAADDIRNVRNFDREGLKDEAEVKKIIRYMKSQPIYYLMIIKSPVNWMISYRNYLRKYPNPRLPHVFHIDDSEDDFKSAINWWNRYADTCIQLEQSHSEIVKIIIYEDLLENFNKVLQQIETQFSLKRVRRELVNFDKTMLPGFHSSNEDFNAEKKMNDIHISGLNAEQYALLSEHLNMRVMQYLQLSLT